MTTDSAPTWKDPQLVDLIQQYWINHRGTTSKARTAAIDHCFRQALAVPALQAFRPDALWTCLQNVYYLEQAQPALQHYQTTGVAVDLIESLLAVRNGWVRSSGVALESVYEHHYNPDLTSVTPALYLLRKGQLKRHPVGQRALNWGTDGIGRAREDDLYLIVDHAGSAWVFGVVQVKASLGDRADQGGPRSQALMSRGYLSLMFTLDPMEVARSPRGMLVNPGYIETINGASAHLNTWHYVYVARSASQHRSPQINGLPSRIKDVDLRTASDSFVQDTRRAASDWLSNGRTLPTNWL